MSCWPAGLSLVLGSLVAFKFYDFVAGELERALGVRRREPVRCRASASPRRSAISFYAFSAASYLIDTFARRLRRSGIAGHVALYVAYFPKILAGRSSARRAFCRRSSPACAPIPSAFVSGLQLIGWGLFKKVVIADNLAPLVDRNFAIAAFASPIELLISVYFFAFQIYCDFSGYTDIAIGVSLLFGIRLMENFRRPYLSRSTAEFWAERWHISLGRWFRDYLYIPLGGSRAGAAAPLPQHHARVRGQRPVAAGLGYGVGWTSLSGARSTASINGSAWQRGRLWTPARRSPAARRASMPLRMVCACS